jgi:hypothetical protein
MSKSKHSKDVRWPPTVINQGLKTEVALDEKYPEPPWHKGSREVEGCTYCDDAKPTIEECLPTPEQVAATVIDRVAEDHAEIAFDEAERGAPLEMRIKWCPDVEEQTTLPLDSAGRKAFPLHAGVLRYFPAALCGVAAVSKFGNDKHNPGEEMHHARGKSMDHADCILRHLIDLEECGGIDENGIPQVAYIAWRALALAQQWYEDNDGAPLAPGAKK